MSPSPDALRQHFISYFAQAGHTHVPSSPLVPQGDPTLMFVNAGMVQFKDVFTGLDVRPYKRAVSVQKCMRVSGKHNDLEEVGRTARHHTLFEMMGNFSFGDYFKEEAIHLAWGFIERELGLPKDRLYITVFGGNDRVGADTEARALWRKISGLPDSRILDKGEKDNFWSMGEVGPCGPCTEIHVDQGSGPVSDADFDSGRVMEIWNNVFMQYNRAADGTMTPLPAPAVDTGMGLERVAALVAGVKSNYHTDLFMPLIDGVAQRSGKPYGRSDSEDDVSMRVIADHARALAFLVADGIQPSSEGRGYVLRRIMRRAIRHGRRLGLSDIFLPEVASRVVDAMGNAYPELRHAASLIAKVASTEEESFRRTLDSGLKILSEALGGTLDKVAQGPQSVLAGDVVFKLYDTYGFPKDLTEVIAAERGIALDEAGFDAAMQAQQARSRGHASSTSVADKATYHGLLQTFGPTPFVGYPHERHTAIDAAEPGPQVLWRRSDTWAEAQCTVVALLQNGQAVDALAEGAMGEVLFDKTPLYAEGGGQVGDRGRIVLGETLQAQVRTTTRPLPELNVAHVQMLTGTLRVGDAVWVGYPAQVRLQTRAHHSATHLLHHALRHVLGDHVKQAGSLVDDQHLRFDFAHFSQVSDQELAAIEDDVNARIGQAVPICIEELDVEAARGKGALALFGEKYGDRVRVISMGESIEFCGGTHAHNTQDLTLMLITREQAVQSGVRRVEAEVGTAALARVAQLQVRLAHVAQALGHTAAAQALRVGAGPTPQRTGPIEETAQHLGQSGAENAEAAKDAATAQAADAAQDAEAAAVLQTLAKSRERIQAWAPQMAALEGPALVISPQALGVTMPKLDVLSTLDRARALRDTWGALVALKDGRAQDGAAILSRLGQRDVGHLAAGMVALLATEREAERFMAAQASRSQAAGAQDLAAGAEILASGVKFVAHSQAGTAASLKELADHIRAALGSGVVALAAHEGDRVTLLVALTPDWVGKLNAGALVREAAPLIDGRGGGRPDMAQAGGRNSAGIPAAMAHLRKLLLTASTP